MIKSRIQRTMSTPLLARFFSQCRLQLLRRMLLSFAIHSLAMLSLLLPMTMSHAETGANATNWSIEQLMQALSSISASQASFTETKSIAMLDQPVESSGLLFYRAPDRLEKRTLKPKAESMRLELDTLTLEQRGKKRALSLQRYPEIAAFIDSIRATLAGDRKALQRSYQLTLSGDEQDWRLNLLPIDPKMQRALAKISISGSGNVLRSIAIQQSDGDSSLMIITPVATPSN